MGTYSGKRNLRIKDKKIQLSHNTVNMYDVESHIAELYDIQQDNRQDIELLRKLLQDHESLYILEPFCGTGRIFLPLLLDGHHISGLDQAQDMLDYAALKISRLSEEIQTRIKLQQMDVVEESWPEGFNLVILGGNCFYELATGADQRKCVQKASHSLKPGRYVYIDNDHMESELASSWIEPGVTKAFPTGICSDGTRIESFCEVIWYDKSEKLVRFRRLTDVKFQDGKVLSKEYIQQKHPVSMDEVKQWLESYGFIIHHIFGDWAGNPYNEKSPRVIFWVQKQQ